MEFVLRWNRTPATRNHAMGRKKMPTNALKSTRQFARVKPTGWRRPATWAAIAILVLLAHNATPAQIINPNGAHPTQRWLEEHLLSSTPQLPFSFTYGKQSSTALLKVGPEETASRQLGGGRTEHRLVWTDQKTGLQVRLTAVEYADSPVVEWTEYFRNDGKV